MNKKKKIGTNIQKFLSTSNLRPFMIFKTRFFFYLLQFERRRQVIFLNSSETSFEPRHSCVRIFKCFGKFFFKKKNLMSTFKQERN